MKIGYVRISSADQNTARQDELMKQLGVDRVFVDKMSGKSMDRPELQAMMKFVREGDIVIVESISRFARNTKDLLELTEQLEKKGVAFVSQKEKLDTSTPTGKFMLTVFGAVAELEREYNRQRQREGIDLAKKRGVYKGRKPVKLPKWDEVVQYWLDGHITGRDACKRLGITKSTFYVKLKERGYYKAEDGKWYKGEI